MTCKGGSSEACAACKYQRRKCSTECPLAPYFPPDQTKMFQNVHKLFGVKNITKILENLDATQKQEAMRSIIYQSYIRDRYPVHGCSGVITHLQFQIKQAEEELLAIRAQLEMYRRHQSSCLADDVDSQSVLGLVPSTSNLFNVFGYSDAENAALPFLHNCFSLPNNTNAYSVDSGVCVLVHHPYYGAAPTQTDTS